MKVVIAGSRTIHNLDIVRRAIELFTRKHNISITEVVSGKALGVDTLGEQWAKIQNVPIKEFPANWKLFGSSAGPIRNEKMAEYCDAGILVWDNKSSGTKNMKGHLERLKKPYYVLKYYDYSYLIFEKAINRLAQQIKDAGHHFDYIGGISRGGLIPAARLSYMLNKPLVPIIWSLNDPHNLNDPCSWLGEEVFKGKRVLLVDDIVDNGDTISSLIEVWQTAVKDDPFNIDADGVLMLSDIEIASLIYNEEQNVPVDYYDMKIKRSENDFWFDFWWEQ